MNNSYAVVVNDLKKNFGTFQAVDSISFEVEKGTVYGILGPNGAGKSTTMRILCGILAPSSGEGFVAGFNITSESEHIKSHIGYMSQKFSLYEDLTVEENIDFFSGIYKVPKNKKKQRKDYVLELTKLSKHLKSRTGIMPTGLKQQLALGCAILHEPSIIFLDEPTAGVDPISRKNFWKLIYDLVEKGVTVIVTTHYVEEAEYFNKIGMIYKGKLVASGTPEYLKTTLMKEKVLELICDNPKEVMGPIHTSGKIKEVGLYGKSLHVVVEDIDISKKMLQDILTELNVPIHRLEVIAPKMEDVFISLIEAHK